MEEDDNNDVMDYFTTFDLEKIPKKKMTYRQLLYKRRTKYGKYVNFGIVFDKMKFRFIDGKLVYEIQDDIDKKEEEKCLNDPFYRALFYCSDFDFSMMPSKREIRLRKMLNDKISRLHELTKAA